MYDEAGVCLAWMLPAYDDQDWFITQPFLLHAQHRYIQATQRL